MKKGNAVHEESFLKFELSLKMGPCLVHGRGKPPMPKARELGSKKKKLSSSMISTGEQNSKPATRSKGGEKDMVREAETKKVGVKVNKEEVATTSKAVETKNIEKVETRKR